ncbi:hypothetical protein U1Q18_016851 [Sarracenia purpurea var. burkii]
MTGVNAEDAKELDFLDTTPNNKVDDYPSVDDPKRSHGHGENTMRPMPSLQEEEEIIRKKYGGMLPKKPPLISKDHERAFFDSADWALGKQGEQKFKGPVEALRPKLQPTPHQQLRSRRSAYAPSDDSEVDEENNNNTLSNDQSCKLDATNNKNADSGI